MSEYIITEENRLGLCDKISEETVKFCGGYLSNRKDITRYRLTVEEYLINWLTESSVGKTLTFSCGKKLFRKPYIEIKLSGEPIDSSIAETDEDIGEFGLGILRSLCLSPEYSYNKSKNILKFEINIDNNSTLGKLALVILLAVIVGLSGLLLPENIISFLRDEIITPIYNTFFNILGCVAGPMIFLSVAWGVYGIGDTSTLSRVGKRMILTFCGCDFLVCSLGLFMAFVFGIGLSSEGGENVKVGSIFTMILNIIPSNIVEPFANGNTLQIIFMSFAVGIALLFLGKRTESVARAIEQVNFLVQFFMEFISKLVPYVIFLVIVSLFWSNSVGILLESWKLLAVLAVAIILTCIGYYLYTALHLRVNVFKLMKKCFPSFVVAFATASSAATFSTNIDICRKKLGISDAVSSFGVPMAMVMHNPIASLNNIAVALFFASYYGIECSIPWLITAVFLSAVLAVSTPPIPGGGTLAYTMLFAQLGIPPKALGVVLTVDMLSDFIITAAEMYCLLPVLTNVASRIGMVDRNILEKD